MRFLCESARLTTIKGESIVRRSDQSHGLAASSQPQKPVEKAVLRCGYGDFAGRMLADACLRLKLNGGCVGMLPCRKKPRWSTQEGR